MITENQWTMIFKFKERYWLFTSISYHQSFTTISNADYFANSNIRHYGMTFNLGLKYALTKEKQWNLLFNFQCWYWLSFSQSGVTIKGEWSNKLFSKEYKITGSFTETYYQWGNENENSGTFEIKTNWKHIENRRSESEPEGSHPIRAQKRPYFVRP